MSNNNTPSPDPQVMGGLRHVAWRWKHANTPEEGHWCYTPGTKKPDPGFTPSYDALVTYEKVFVPALETPPQDKMMGKTLEMIASDFDRHIKRAEENLGECSYLNWLKHDLSQLRAALSAREGSE